MRVFAWSLMLAGAVFLGCNQPVETIPSVDDSPSSGTTADDHDHAEGDHDHAEGDSHEEGKAHDGSEEGHADSDSHAEGKALDESHPEGDTDSKQPADAAPADSDSAASVNSAVRFMADKSIKVPTMMCPYSCWPKVKETLVSLPGVDGVQLAKQLEESAIDNPVVELKLSESFDPASAIAALADASFAGAEIVN